MINLAVVISKIKTLVLK
uniref:Uncharacterized protein n=1 Tax=Anguilla anguilla TaxID=7936 RepID=A0A0E9PHD0_ANGAN